MKISYTELRACSAAIVIFYDAVADIHRIAGLDVVEVSRHVECYS